MQKVASERVRQLDHDVALFTVGPHLDELRETYAAQPEVLAYLDQIKSDLPEHLDDFRISEREGEQAPLLGLLPERQREEHLARYRVNVFVDNDASEGAPVIVERNPTYYNLIGRIDYCATFGALVTDFRKIRPGGTPACQRRLPRPASTRRSGCSIRLGSAHARTHQWRGDDREPGRAVQRLVNRAIAARTDPPQRQGDPARLARTLCASLSAGPRFPGTLQGQSRPSRSDGRICWVSN